MKKNLDLFKPEFQYEAVKALIEETGVFAKMSKIIDQNSFSDVQLRAIVGILKDYFKKNGRVPDYVSLKVICGDKYPKEYAEYATAIARLKSASSVGQDTIIESMTKFFKLKYLVKTANKILDGIETNEDDEKLVKNATKAFEDMLALGQENNVTVSFNKDAIIRACMAGDNEVIPTGIPELDERLCGGLGRGEIGLFVAPTGYGKTTAGTIFAHNAAKAGFKALQIFFEDKPDDMVRKHIAMEYERNINYFREMDEKVATVVADDMIANKAFESLSDNLKLVRMSDGTTTVEDIESKIKSLINSDGFRPDLIIIDYFSSLKHSASPMKDKNDAEAYCMKKIIDRIAVGFNCAVWVLQQTNRTAVQQDSQNGMGNWQGSFQATQPASVWLELRRTAEQRKEYKADILFNKTRHSHTKEDLLDIKFDNGRMVLDCKTAGRYDEDLPVFGYPQTGYTGNYAGDFNPRSY